VQIEKDTAPEGGEPERDNRGVQKAPHAAHQDKSAKVEVGRQDVRMQQDDMLPVGEEPSA
jgi:hypothetical protein